MIAGFLLTAYAALSLIVTTSLSSPKPIIIDTDIYSDVDDVGSLAVANVLHNCGLADLRGVVINERSKYGALAANTINTYFLNGDIPIGAIRPLSDDTFFDKYRYLDSLGSAQDNSITIISIGFLTNIAELLESPPDQHSSSNGRELISSKVKELVVMGGTYPAGWEFNFGGLDPASTKAVVENWPANVAITYSGAELGGGIYSGYLLPTHSPPNSPILAAYQWYVGRGSTVRESWDPVTTLYGILGLDGFQKLGFKAPLVFANSIGYNSVLDNGTNSWVYDSKVTNQHWLELADGVTNSTVSFLLDQFLVHNPLDSRCI
ncbi:inosine-uridine nucleoside n-ribohydrolase [Apiospora hydei]|uniref:Inosine-uridine nucleoside n-ribohydrolase n=1 Tax=Apiospora hydei TaxID=1337664 RepID=A0ABR1WEP1_9PEZI